MAVKIAKDLSLAAWEKFIAAHPEANFLQSWWWGEFNEQIGRSVYRLGYEKSGKLVGVMLAVVEPARRGRYLTVAGGPIIDWRDESTVAAWVDSLKDLARRERCVFVRVRPQLLADTFSRELFARQGFRSAPMHLSAELTSQLQLDRSEEDLLANMRQQTRYEIRRAQKIGIEVIATKDRAELHDFYKLQLETAQRQGFVPFSEKFLTTQFAVFAQADSALLYTASYEGNVLAQAFVIFYGEEAAYHYGVSTLDGRKYPGAYLIQWEAIREAKRRNMSRYNFWGVAPHGETQHRFHGVSVFKRGFGGEDVEYLHAQDLVIAPARYGASWSIEQIRKRLRRV